MIAVIFNWNNIHSTCMHSSTFFQTLYSSYSYRRLLPLSFLNNYNISECKILQCPLYSYQMCGIHLEIVEQHNYTRLGVCLHHRMSWQPHIDFICNKANHLLGFLHRNLWHCSSKLKECAYKQLILPTLDIHWSGTHISTNWSTSLKWYNTGQLGLFWTNLGTSTTTIAFLKCYTNWTGLLYKPKENRLDWFFKLVFLTNIYHRLSQWLPPNLATPFNCSNSTQEQIYITFYFYPEQSLIRTIYALKKLMS